MATIRTGPTVDKIAGSTGNKVYSSWKGRGYIRSKSTNRSNPSSSRQASARAGTTVLSKAWSNALTVNQRALWDEAAQRNKLPVDPASSREQGSRVIIPQPRPVLSGYNAFIRANQRAIETGIREFGNPILTPSSVFPSPPTSLNAAPVPVSEVELTWTEPPGLPVGSRVRIWVLSYDAGVYRQHVASVDIGIETYALSTVRIAQGRTIGIKNMPGHYLVQADIIDSNGNQSPPSNTQEIQVTQRWTSVIDSLDNLVLDSLGNYVIVPH